MRVKSPKRLFGIACLSSAVGLILYWVMFMNVLPRLMRPEASTILPLMSGVIGTASCALLYFGLSNMIESARSRGKAGGTLVLRRGEGGRVVSIGWAEAGYVVKANKANKAEAPIASEAKQVQKAQRAQKRGKSKYVGAGVLVVLALVGYVSSMALAGYTFQDVARGVYSPFMVVSSGSMQPVLNYGDLIFVRNEPPERIVVGDIIAFNVPSPYDRVAASPTVHRVVDKWVEDGAVYFKTMGDNNQGEDPWNVPGENVIGKCVWKVPYVGLAVLYLRSPYGLALIASVLAAPFIYSLLRRGKAVKEG
ncbi:MAG: signal peptidase I [Candidatus Bathyarchaeota archaeon]|nr:signal peptidase I [Candidatus Bathyarchaeota archaeon]